MVRNDAEPSIVSKGNQRPAAAKRTPVDVLKGVARKIAGQFDASRLFFLRMDEAADAAKVLYDWRVSDDIPAAGSFELSRFLGTKLRQQIFTGDAIAVSDINRDSRVVGQIAAHKQYGTRAFLACPFISDGKVLFELVAVKDRPHEWTEQDISFLTAASEAVFLRFMRAEAEEALGSRDAQLQLIADHTPLILERCSLSLTYKFINKAGAELFGMKPGQMVGRSIEQMMGESGFRRIEPYVKLVLEGETVSYEMDIVYPAAGNRRMRVNYIPEHSSSGRVIGWFAAAVDVTEENRRKQVEQQRNELLKREAEARREAETLNELSMILAGELDLKKVVQSATDAATELTRAKFGAFFYNLIDDKGESYQLYTLSGAPRSAFDRFGMPRNTPIFDPTFRGEGVVRIDDVTQDARYGKMAPHHGLPKGHLAVRSYLAAPVISRSGNVLGGLFLGHPDAGVFHEHHERLITGLAAIAAVAVDNAHLYGEAQREIERRRQIENALRQSENQVHVITDALPALISYVDRNEKYVFANETYRQWFGVEPKEIVGKSPSSIFGPKAYATIKPWVAQALSGSEARFETEIEYQNGTTRYVHAAYVPDIGTDGEVRGYFGLTTDMTDLKRSEELLQATEDKTSLMMDICRDYAILSTDPAGIVDSWNKGAEQIFGYPEDEAIGMNAKVLFTPEDIVRGEHKKEMRTARELGRASDERWHIRKDGTRFYASGVMMPVLVGKELTGYAKIASDLTERQRHAEELQKAHDELELRVADRTRELAETNAALIREAEARLAGEQQRILLLRRLVTSQEFERRRIARDIHDQLGQRLTGLRLKLASLRSTVGEDGDIAARVARLQEVSEQLDSEVSFLAWELRPTALDDLGLVEALRTFVQEWSRHYDIKADFQELHLGTDRFESEIETHLYRITQEALNNTMKHAGATNITVMLERRENEVILIIEDDGKGFDPAALPIPRKSGKGLGLTGMSERATLIGGVLEIESSSAGTTIYVRVPTPGHG